MTDKILKNGYLISLSVFFLFLFFNLIQATVFYFFGGGGLMLYFVISMMVLVALSFFKNFVWVYVLGLNLMAIGTFMPTNLLFFGDGSNTVGLLLYLFIYTFAFFLSFFVAYHSPIPTSSSSSSSSSKNTTRRNYYPPRPIWM